MGVAVPTHKTPLGPFQHIDLRAFQIHEVAGQGVGTRTGSPSRSAAKQESEALAARIARGVEDGQPDPSNNRRRRRYPLDFGESRQKHRAKGGLT
jgi:hypothetical protein